MTRRHDARGAGVLEFARLGRIAPLRAGLEAGLGRRDSEEPFCGSGVRNGPGRWPRPFGQAPQGRGNSAAPGRLFGRVDRPPARARVRSWPGVRRPSAVTVFRPRTLFPHQATGP